MPLNKEDFTDEQWEAIQAEADRRATGASETARKKALKDFEAEKERLITEALNEERAKLEMDEAQKLEAERKKLEDARKAFDADRKSFATKQKLLTAGFAEEQIEALTPMFLGLDDKAFETTVDAFINTTTDIVKNKVDAEKQTLLNNGTPPSQSTDGPVDTNTLVNEFISKGEDALAIELMLTGAQ